MNALDLSNKPPRLPRAELAGVVFLPRSIDKVRASLPGGNLGPYQVTGFTGRLFDQLGITPEAFTAAVAAAASDDDVAKFVRENTTQAKIDAWNAFAATREPRGGDRKLMLEDYPWIVERPDLIVALDILAEDDKQYFAART